MNNDAGNDTLEFNDDSIVRSHLSDSPEQPIQTPTMEMDPYKTPPRAARTCPIAPPNIKLEHREAKRLIMNEL